MKASSAPESRTASPTLTLKVAFPLCLPWLCAVPCATATGVSPAIGLSVDRAMEDCAAVRPMAAGTASASAARAARRRSVLMRRHFLPLREADVDRRSAGGCRARAPWVFLPYVSPRTLHRRLGSHRTLPASGPRSYAATGDARTVAAALSSSAVRKAGHNVCDASPAVDLAATLHSQMRIHGGAAQSPGHDRFLGPHREGGAEGAGRRRRERMGEARKGPACERGMGDGPRRRIAAQAVTSHIGVRHSLRIEGNVKCRRRRRRGLGRNRSEQRSRGECCGDPHRPLQRG